MEENVWVVMLLTGLAGGFGHCVGMCGPVVAAYSLGEQNLRYLHHILYNLGRITTYMFMGAVVGLTGSFLVLTASRKYRTPLWRWPGLRSLSWALR